MVQIRPGQIAFLEYAERQLFPAEIEGTQVCATEIYMDEYSISANRVFQIGFT